MYGDMENGFKRYEYGGIELLADKHIEDARVVLFDTLSMRMCFPVISKQALWKRVLLWFRPWETGWYEDGRYKHLFGRIYFEG